MNPALVGSAARNILSIAEININRLAGRELVPVQSDLLGIETSSICNLECCFCAYPKKQSARVTMKNAFFASCVAQAVAMGYRRYILTPNTGDIFMDHHIFDKLKLLEETNGVDGYEFHTNFTIPKARDIGRLVSHNKLKHFTISIYGHDLETFIAITKSNEKVYRRLLLNLETLLGVLDRAKCKFDIAIRSTRDMPRHAETDLLRLLDRFKAGGIRVKRGTLYHNWGGYITPEDIKGLAIDVKKPDAIYKRGACTLLFTGVQIMATGIVHACACVDFEASLQIGDLNTRPLREIISTKNPEYMNIIEQQQRGEFPPICSSCGFYKSIYHTRSTYLKNGISTQTIEQFKTRLDAKCGNGLAPLPQTTPKAIDANAPVTAALSEP
jgi:MoaA/NifB/PqqE/SkfB family radical SAM enzyme